MFLHLNHNRVDVGGWQLFDSGDCPLAPRSGVQAEDAYKTHILENGSHPVTVFESADAVDEVNATTGQ